MFVCCECCVLSGRGLCDELITRPEESYRLWCIVVCDLESSRMRRPMTCVGSQRHQIKKPTAIFTGHASGIKENAEYFRSFFVIFAPYMLQ